MQIMISLIILISTMWLLHWTDAFHITVGAILTASSATVWLWWHKRQANPELARIEEYPSDIEKTNRWRDIVFGTAIGLFIVVVIAGGSAAAQHTPIYALFYDGDCAHLRGTLDALESGKGYEYGLTLVNDRLKRKASAACKQALTERKAHLLLGWAMLETGESQRIRLEAARTTAIEAHNQDLVARSESEIRALKLQTEVQRLRIPTRESAEGLVVTLADMLFQMGRDDLTANGIETIRQVAKVLNSTEANKEVRIEDHTDDTGSPRFNEWLSRQRAETVMKSLAVAGVEVKRMATAGYGALRPTDPGTISEARARNRRVEIIIRAR